MGMRRSADCIVFKTVLRRNGYVQRDVDDKALPPGDAERGVIWEGLPEKLVASFEVDAAAQKVNKTFPVSSLYYCSQCDVSELEVSRTFQLVSAKMQARSSVSFSSTLRLLNCIRCSDLRG